MSPSSHLRTPSYACANAHNLQWSNLWKYSKPVVGRKQEKVKNREATEHPPKPQGRHRVAGQKKKSKNFPGVEERRADIAILFEEEAAFQLFFSFFFKRPRFGARGVIRNEQRLEYGECQRSWQWNSCQASVVLDLIMPRGQGWKTRLLVQTLNQVCCSLLCLRVPSSEGFRGR